MRDGVHKAVLDLQTTSRQRPQYHWYKGWLGRRRHPDHVQRGYSLASASHRQDSIWVDARTTVVFLNLQEDSRDAWRRAANHVVRLQPLVSHESVKTTWLISFLEGAATASWLLHAIQHACMTWQQMSRMRRVIRGHDLKCWKYASGRSWTSLFTASAQASKKVAHL